MKKQIITTRKNNGEAIETLEGYTTELAGVPLVVHKVGKKWQVSEPRTGMFIGCPETSRERAIANAKKRIETIITGKSLAEIVNQKAQRLGLDLA